MNILEQLGGHTLGLSQTQKPFEAWAGSPIQTWEVTMKMLNIGELADVAKYTADATPMEIVYLSKVFLLAKSLQLINGHPVVDLEDIEAYNKDHNLTGTQELDIFGYKILFIKKLSEIVVNRLAYMYDQLVDNYMEQILGRPLPDELRTVKVDGVDLSGANTNSIGGEDNAGTIDGSTEDSPTA